MNFFLKSNRQFILITANIWISVALFTIFTPSAALAGTSVPIDEVVTLLQQTYEKTKDFKANFIQETTIHSIKKTDIEEGTVFFKNPKNMLWNYSKPKAKKLVINSRKAWLYLPQEKVAYTQEANYIFKSRILIKFLSGLGNLKDDFTIKYAKPQALDKQGNYLLVLIPLEKIPSLNPFQITVDKNTSLILQISFEDTMGNSTALKFSNIVTNTGFSEKMFQFKPPEGVSIFNMP
ncbi:MAG: outer membrane lipoprotein carrier protein LolA [Smithellaceae bacterium]